MFTKEERDRHDEYVAAKHADQKRVDRAWVAANEILSEDGRKLDNGDEAEILIAALWRYYQSKR